MFVVGQSANTVELQYLPGTVELWQGLYVQTITRWSTGQPLTDHPGRLPGLCWPLRMFQPFPHLLNPPTHPLAAAAAAAASA